MTRTRGRRSSIARGARWLAVGLWLWTSACDDGASDAADAASSDADDNAARDGGGPDEDPSDAGAPPSPVLPDAGSTDADGDGGSDTVPDASVSQDDDGGLPDPEEDPEPSVRAFSGMEILQYAALSPLGDVPADPTNAFADDEDAAALGQQLYFDKRYSGRLAVASDLGAVDETGKLACFSCHSGEYLDDQRSVPKNVSLGAGFHSRNAPTSINSAFYPVTNWGGRFSAPWELPLAVAESGVIMNSTRLAVAHLIFDEYKDEYEAIFPAMAPEIGTDLVRFPLVGKPKPAPSATNPTPPDGAWEGMAADDRTIINEIFVNYGKAIEAYMRLLVSRNAPFDDFVAGDDQALAESEQRGLQVFLGKGRCVNCHLGPHFSDGAFHNLGVQQVGPNVPASDDGRFKDIPPLLASPFNSASPWSDDITTGRLLGLTNPPPESARGQFRTPSLRGVALTAPYMHAGQLATLEEVVDFYDVGGDVPVAGKLDPLIVPLLLTAQEKTDLVAFLRSLTGEPVDAALLVDTSTQ